MATQPVKVNSKGLVKKVDKAGKAVVKAQRRAKRDAAKQTRTAMSRDVGKTINLPSRRIKDKITIRRRRNGDEQQVRTAYAPVPAHQFTGWSYTHRTGGRLARETARRSTLASRGNVGLRVRFTKGRQPIEFPRAFRTTKIGSGRVFIQRAGRERYPLEAITGPNPHGIVDENSREYADKGAVVYRRRLAYWKRRELQRV
jgi:hypothetical protein